MDTLWIQINLRSFINQMDASSWFMTPFWFKCRFFCNVVWLWRRYKYTVDISRIIKIKKVGGTKILPNSVFLPYYWVPLHQLDSSTADAWCVSSLHPRHRSLQAAVHAANVAEWKTYYGIHRERKQQVLCRVDATYKWCDMLRMCSDAGFSQYPVPGPQNWEWAWPGGHKSFK